jgi:hypothetical protein
MSIASIGSRSSRRRPLDTSFNDKKGNKSVIISYDELNRIKESCTLNNEKDAAIKAQEKQEMYDKSQ